MDKQTAVFSTIIYIVYIFSFHYTAGAEEKKLFGEKRNDTLLNILTRQKKIILPITGVPLQKFSRENPNFVSITESRHGVKELSCMSNETLVDHQIMNKKIAPLQFLCPPFTTPVNGECLDTHRPEIICPFGYDLQNGVCRRFSVIEAQLTCIGEDEHLEESGCVSHIALPPECPPGFAMRNGTCSQTIHSMIDCPAEFMLNPSTRQCIKSSTTAAIIICPDGSNYAKKLLKCISITQPAPRCPRSYTYDTIRRKCLRPLAESPAPCPDGFLQIDSVCRMEVTSPATPYCHDGFNLNNENLECTREIISAPQCPNGFKLSRTEQNKCEKLVREDIVCPLGTMQSSDKQCERLAEQKPISRCSPGFILTLNHCERNETLVPRLSCDNDCMKVRTSRIAYACPKDMRFVDDAKAPKCVADPVCVSTPVRCLTETAAALRTTSNELDSPVGETNVVDLGCLPSSSSECNAEPKVVLAQPHCPEGGEINNGQCVMKEMLTAEKICDFGVLDVQNNQCVRQVTSLLRKECPPGTTRKGPICLSREFVQPITKCPPNTYNIAPNGSCIASIPLPPQGEISLEKIPASFRCNAGRLAANEKSCIESRTIPIEMACPEGSERGNWKTFSCIVTTKLIVPNPIKRIIAPRYVCPNGIESNGPICQKRKIIPALTICPADATPTDSGFTCVRFSPLVELKPRKIITLPLPSCPLGTTLLGNSCIIIEEISIQSICKNGYIANNDYCLRYLPMQIVCPIGASITLEGCLQQNILPSSKRRCVI